MPSTTTYSPTADSYLNGLLGGVKWSVSSFTYSFPTSASVYVKDYGSGEPFTGFESLNATQQNVVRATFSMYASVANLTFREVSESSTAQGDFRFAESDIPELQTAWAYYPYSGTEGGDVWLNNSSGQYDGPVKGNYAFSTFLHEVGHALGLKHPHEADGSFNAMPKDRDSVEYTVMSYRSYVGASTTSGYTNETWGYPQSLMMYDIAAIQKLYGANFNSNSGDTVYAWSPSSGELTINGVKQGAPGGNRIFQTVWDGNGVDTYNFGSYGTNLKIDLHPGAWTTTSTTQLAYLGNSKYAVGNIANALLYGGDVRSLIENAIGGSGADRITGNLAANTLTGNAGNDKLYGVAGDDRLIGGAGDDLLDGGDGFDTAVFSGLSTDYSWRQNGDGSWAIVDERTGSLDGADTLWRIESLAFSDKSLDLATTTTTTTTTSRSTSSDDQTLDGDGSANVLTGGSGNDTLDGKGGKDKLYGLGGDDVLIGSGGADLLDGGEGVDTASYATAGSGVTADLKSPSNNTKNAYGDKYVSIENLTGSAYADYLRGDNGSNVLRGGEGDDKLQGRGGDDYLDGGIGKDTSIYSGQYGNYSLTQHSDGSWTVQDLRSGSPDGTDTLIDVEVLKFSDGSITLPTSSSTTASSTDTTELEAPENIPLPVAYADVLDFAGLSDRLPSFLGDSDAPGRWDGLNLVTTDFESGRANIIKDLLEEAKVAMLEGELWNTSPRTVPHQSDWWQTA